MAVPGDVVREQAPQRWPSLTSDVVTPLLQAVITALVVFVMPSIVMQRWRDWDFVITFASLFGTALALAWFWRMGVITETLWAIEEATGLDINRDSSVGKPRSSVHVEITSGNSQRRIDIKGLETVEDLRKLAILGVTDRLNERQAKHKFGWTREEWQETRDELIHRELVAWNGRDGSKQGVSLTEVGEKVMRAILDDVLPAEGDLR